MIAVRYSSKSGNTEKVANLIGEKLGVKAASIEEPLPDKADKLYLGGAVHGKMYADLRKYAEKIDPSQVDEVFMFGTSGGAFSIKTEFTKALDKSGVKIGDESLFLHGFAPKIKADLNDKQVEELTAFVDATK
ncbi:flavodoxin family protein [Ligilactobacillus pobuzihii]|uniref:Flavodoxin domain-containing protein n=1 Tax=Ligilactobacillus pobuzihii TaxID=449659 RepID=A0A0R2LPU5_9LACO|nr:flavodoxin family protein [Ligilactobacillus pobuzihii]KRK10300.1 hypothetical protein FD11_GL002050 [Ligilactobacillus pobuzihii E100301 = KCTC 13174]KRO02027.1 hypothetical protein IV66_GL001695 [Ligilactobacillus pobuzihii]GEN48217.1 hypothetical protein LPO01_10090 [Ligilactobacillus pobuzihii]